MTEITRESLPDAAAVSRRRRRRLPQPILRASTAMLPKVVPGLSPSVQRLLTGLRDVKVDGNTLDPTLQLFVAGLRLSGVTGMSTDDDVALSRTTMRDTCLRLGGPALPAVVEELSIPGPAGPVVVRRYRANGLVGRDTAALVYFHGGGFVVGDLDCYDTLCRRLCRDAGVQVFSVDYRLAPEHRAPAAVDDCCAVYAWLAGHTDELDIPADRIAVGGDSAGGALAASVSQWAVKTGQPVPCLQWLLYPITELTAQTRSRTLFHSGYILTGHDMEFFRRLYLGADSGGPSVAATDPRVSPLLADDLSRLPPALVVTAGFDPLRDEGAQYAAALTQAGVPADVLQMGSMTHGFINFAGLGGGVERSVADVISAVGAHLQRV